MDKFETLLQELGDKIGSHLVPDSLSTCLLVFNNGVKIQLELDRSEEHLIIGATLGEVPPGKYREQLLLEALKNNRFSEIGTFAFSLKKNELVLYDKKPFDTIDAANLFSFLQSLSEKALVWKNALASGSVPSSPVQGPQDSIFSIKK